MIKHFFLFLLLATGLLQYSIGQMVPSLVNYQGRLTNSSGDLVSDTVTVSVAVYTNATQGASVYTEVVGPVVVNNGIYSFQFGAGVGFTEALRHPEAWLEVSVGSETLSPRQRLVAVPYALHTRYADAAGNATSVSGSVAASQLAGFISSANIASGSISSVMLGLGAVGTDQMADGAITEAKMDSRSDWFPLVTFDNPSHTKNQFGASVTTVGTEWVLVGSPGEDLGAGAAYLFDRTGVLRTPFWEPIPTPFASFGSSVAGVGADHVLIGAFANDTGALDAGAAYLFRIDGSLVSTFSHPAPSYEQYFGSRVAALDEDHVIIASWYDDAGTNDSGAVYLFHTNGALVTTFTNPTPAPFDNFGSGLAALGGEYLIIGASGDDEGGRDSGAAYLFRTNGTLVTTFSNPAPADEVFFGATVSSMGSDGVLIGAPYALRTGDHCGAAYLFQTDGTLVNTFNNPTPELSDKFGKWVSALGADRVAIGEPDDRIGGQRAGSVHVFHRDGALLYTIGNPAPGHAVPGGGDSFGNSLAALGSDQLVIGAVNDDTILPGAGITYLFGLQAYTPGLVAHRVLPGAIDTFEIQDGAVTAAKIGGVLSSEQIPELDASKLTSGVLPGARLSGTYSNPLTFDNAGNSFIGSFSGNGFGLTDLPGRHALDAADGSPANVVYVDDNGRVGIGTTAPAATLHIAGDVKLSGTITYEPIRQKFVSVSAASFHPSSGGTVFNNTGEFIYPTGVNTHFHASISLPDGATVTSLRWTASASGSDSLAQLQLQRRDLSGGYLSMATCFFDSDTSFADIDNSIAAPIVDNAQYVYYLHMYLNQNSGSATGGGAILSYTITAP